MRFPSTAAATTCNPCLYPFVRETAPSLACACARCYYPLTQLLTGETHVMGLASRVRNMEHPGTTTDTTCHS